MFVRCNIWYCTKYTQISDAGYQFLSSVEAEDIAWFCKSCVQPAKVALLKDKSIEDKLNELVEKWNQRIKAVKSNLPKKVENTEFEKIQRKVGELEEEIKKVQNKSQGGGSWTDMANSIEKKKPIKLIEKSLEGQGKGEGMTK